MRFADQRRAGSPQWISGVYESGAAYILTREFLESGRSLLAICADEDSAERFYSDLRFFFRLFSVPEEEGLRYLPGWEYSPYKKLSPGISRRLQRLSALYEAAHQPAGGRMLFVSCPSALLQAAPDPKFLERSFRLRRGQRLPPDEMYARLVAMGYTATDGVEDQGGMNRRGGIIDLFSPGQGHPVRIEFFDVEIESLRFYNPETQRSLDADIPEEGLLVLPAREFDCSPENLLASRERIKQWCDSKEFPRSSRERIGELLQQGIVTQEMDYLLPFFREENSFAWNFFSGVRKVWVEPGEAKERWRSEWEELCEQYHSLLDQQQVCAPPETLFLAGAMEETAADLCVERLHLSGREAGGIRLKQDMILSLHTAEGAVSQKKSVNISALCSEIDRRRNEGSAVLIAANSQSQIDRLSFLLSEHKIRTSPLQGEPRAGLVYLVPGSVSRSFHLDSENITLLSEDDIFGRKLHRPSTTRDQKTAAGRVEAFQVDDYVVHADHGVARFKGLVKMRGGGIEGDFAHLEYAGNDKLYLPIYRLDLLQKYVGAPGTGAHLDRLGTNQFEKKKEKVKSAIKDIAANLLKVHAERSSRPGFAFSEPDELFREFEAEFPFDETPDQLKAIQQTIDDMCDRKPMDRLICGDVGFGKTEVAIRAAFKAAQDNKQTAVLVPTTILAEQHYQSFSMRMKGHPVRVASLSRFKSRKEQQKILEDLSEGRVDIIIGTHRLLSKDVRFKDLGLLVIDEEQRFGVEHKEKLKSLKATTDVLTLTATPIPRTLHMSLMGMRDISIISTPPSDRLSIKTVLAAFDKDIIKSAISTELSRGGQVFFIHNRVQTIDKIAESLQEILPNAKLGIAHGQMNEGELERVMLGFYQKEFDILLATTIIENGLDVPNANTIIVNRADTFGLSQLYQIRGRVGRSQVRAYAYFLIPEDTAISGEARERLSVLQRFVELGSGFAVASHDLELRGGGNILGEAQSGHIADVGYDLYLELLEEEVLRLKGEEPAERDEDVEINSPFPALLPDSYIPDMRSRLLFYKRLSGLKTEEALDDAARELEDRYGKVPFETQELFWLLRVKILLRRMGFRAITIGKKAFTITAGKNPKVDPGRIFFLVQKQERKLALNPEGKLTVYGEFLSLKSVNDEMRKLMESIASL